MGEFDGKGKYVQAALRDGMTADEAVYREKLREDRVRALGHGFVRWRWADLTDPSRLRCKLLAAGLRPLLAAGLRPGCGTSSPANQKLVR
ncbi:hypothetical protein StoSoilB19_01850 [Arthrobacter sp. StoSoilB19]|uniref:hypothetical protein n=1 Tax=Arthrobacter sp. StoSoilB19 TaxID=2830994 RepID=UPI001CC527F4|nr:hypothetical protein [Arthrobacter sp. StoSoilB19]BCW52811.1 hypothetical protein StoSoilB19_01850 [Arthrobacter sp. StoSoilB19]